MRKSLLTVAVAAAALAATGLTASAAEKLKIGLVYLGPVGDFGWTYQHEVGRQGLVKALGDKIETTYLENVSEGPDSERSIEQLARAGHKLIFTLMLGLMLLAPSIVALMPEITSGIGNEAM